MVLMFRLIRWNLRSSSSQRWFRGGSPMIESPQIFISFPFPRIHVNWDRKKVRDLRRMGRIAEPFLVVGGWSRHRRRLLEKYFFQRVVLHHEGLPEMMFQSCLVPRARFWRARFRICSPPFHQGLVAISQLTKWSFFSLCFPPFHRKFLRRDSMEWRMLLGANIMELW